MIDESETTANTRTRRPSRGVSLRRTALLDERSFPADAHPFTRHRSLVYLNLGPRTTMQKSPQLMRWTSAHQWDSAGPQRGLCVKKRGYRLGDNRGAFRYGYDQLGQQRRQRHRSARRTRVFATGARGRTIQVAGELRMVDGY